MANKNSEPKDVVSIVSGKNVRVEISEYTTFTCISCKIRNLEFARAYELESTVHDDIENCVYRVDSRKFTDLSFVKGTLLENLKGNGKNGVELMQYEDGKKFLRFHYDVPTFDIYDREYDGNCLVAVYRDDSGVKLIHCHYGYKLPRIYFYLNLQESNAEFDKWLEYIK